MSAKKISSRYKTQPSTKARKIIKEKSKEEPSEKSSVKSAIYSPTTDDMAKGFATIFHQFIKNPNLLINHLNSLGVDLIDEGSWEEIVAKDRQFYIKLFTDFFQSKFPGQSIENDILVKFLEVKKGEIDKQLDNVATEIYTTKEGKILEGEAVKEYYIFAKKMQNALSDEGEYYIFDFLKKYAKEPYPETLKIIQMILDETNIIAEGVAENIQSEKIGESIEKINKVKLSGD